ncbi:MAG: hypothetical protein CM15mP74_19070 [Halieaceae bacterium]|nr:MAG: hypothetical protein CM15mP74_19070 [Halieaceae bacterium]
MGDSSLTVVGDFTALIYGQFGPLIISVRTFSGGLPSAALLPLYHRRSMRDRVLAHCLDNRLTIAVFAEPLSSLKRLSLALTSSRADPQFVDNFGQLFRRGRRFQIEPTSGSIPCS